MEIIMTFFGASRIDSRWLSGVLAATLASVAVACNPSVDVAAQSGGPPLDTTSGGAPVVGPLGTATGSIKVWLLVRTSPGATAEESGTTWIDLSLSDANDKPLQGAQVEASADGKKVFFTGEYAANLPERIGSFDLSVRHKSGTRTGIHLVGPSVATAMLSSTPVLNRPTTLTWSPNNENDVTSVAFTSVDVQHVWSSDTLADPGTMQLPKEAFPLSGSMGVGLQRTRTWDDGDAAHAEFQSEAEIGVVVP